MSEKRQGESPNLHRIALLAVLTAMSLIVFVVESFFPPIILPGAKLGLSNIFSLLALVMWSPADAIILVIARTLLGSLIVGNMSALIYSLGAGLVAIAVSSLLLYTVFPRISFLSISIVSAVVHNLVQNIIFCLISSTPQMFAYMPYLAILGIFSGTVVGYSAYFILKFVPTSVYAKALPQAKKMAIAPTCETLEVSHSSDKNDI